MKTKTPDLKYILYDVLKSNTPPIEGTKEAFELFWNGFGTTNSLYL